MIRNGAKFVIVLKIKNAFFSVFSSWKILHDFEKFENHKNLYQFYSNFFMKLHGIQLIY